MFVFSHEIAAGSEASERCLLGRLKEEA